MAAIGPLSVGGAQGIGGVRVPGGMPQADQGVGGIRRAGPGDTGRLSAEGPSPSFSDVLKQALGQVSQLQDESKDAIGAFLRGENVELHDVMAATEEAGIALELLIEIRNKMTDAYRAVINMQT